jgi:DNA-binding response OmpR family regulator
MGKKALIIDDEKNIVNSVKHTLERENIECLTAYDGDEGLRMVKKEMPDIIILDVMMPTMNGYKVSRLLKFDEKYKNIPIIMLTARSQEKDIELGKITGADEYLTKPFYMDELIKLVNKHLGIIKEDK